MGDTWNPNLSSTRLLLAAQRAINDYPFPVTLKQLYYRLVREGEIDRTSQNLRKLSTLMLNARRYGRVPPDLFVNSKALSLPESMDLANIGWKINRQAFQSNYLEIWVDDSALIPFVDAATGRYDIPIRSLEGFASYGFIYAASQRFIDAASRGMTPRIVHLSDFGYAPDAALRPIVSELSAILGLSQSEVTSMIVRAGVLPEHILSFSLPYSVQEVPEKEVNFYEESATLFRSIGLPPNIKVELESLDPLVLRGLILNVVFGILDYESIKSAEALENDRRQVILGALESFGEVT